MYRQSKDSQSGTVATSLQDQPQEKVPEAEEANQTDRKMKVNLQHSREKRDREVSQ